MAPAAAYSPSASSCALARSRASLLMAVAKRKAKSSASSDPPAATCGAGAAVDGCTRSTAAPRVQAARITAAATLAIRDIETEPLLMVVAFPLASILPLAPDARTDGRAGAPPGAPAPRLPLVPRRAPRQRGTLTLRCRTLRACALRVLVAGHSGQFGAGGRVEAQRPLATGVLRADCVEEDLAGRWGGRVRLRGRELIGRHAGRGAVVDRRREAAAGRPEHIVEHQPHVAGQGDRVP